MERKPSLTRAVAILFLGELHWEQLVVQDDIEQRAVDLQPAVVVNEAQFSEPVHEKAHPRADFLLELYDSGSQ